MKKILLVVLSYNNAEYISSTLSSIIQNDITHFDIVINDDASLDNSVQVIKKFMDENSSITSNWILNINSKNLGINLSIKRIIQNHEADWVKIIAGDDEFELESLRQYYQLGAIHDFNSTLIIGGMRYIGSTSCIVGSRSAPNELLYTTPWIKQANFYVNTIPAASVMIGRKIFLSVLDTTKARNAEDWPILRFAILNNLKFVIEDRFLVRYRMHSKSISRSFFRKKYDSENPIAGDVQLLLEENLASSKNVFTRMGIKIQILQLNSNSQFGRITIKLLKLLNPQYLLFCLLRSAKK